jgi:uncharacterized cupin superfamily protein
VAAADAWFVVNLRDAAWETNDALGAACFFEGADAPFAQVGINVRVLDPDRPRGLYHAESRQEGFVVLAGQALLLIEEEERPLRAWDFVHCPAGTAHAIVAAGEEPCVVLMAGARGGEHTFSYPRSELALRHSVGVETPTTSPLDAQAQTGIGEWRPGRPATWDRLPWA